MKLPKFLRGTLNFFKKGGNERLILLVSLFLAFFIWLIHNLSLEYSQYFQYSVVVKSNIEGRANISANSDELILRGKSSGFYIMGHKSRKGGEIVITIDDPKVFKRHASADDEYLYVAAGDLRQKLVEMLAPNLEVDYIVTDTLKFLFPIVYNKEVPVVAITNIRYKNQYMLTEPISLEPEKITIYGDEAYLAGIDSVFTNTITLKNVSRSVQGIQSLSKIKGVRFSADQVYYTIPVDRYVEQEAIVPITVTNIPPERELLLLPSQVTVTYRQSFYTNSDRSDFVFNVDYSDFINSINSVIIPECISKPKGIYYYSIEPPYVEGVLIENNSDR